MLFGLGGGEFDYTSLQSDNIEIDNIVLLDSEEVDGEEG